MLKYIIGYFVIGFIVVFIIDEIEKRRGNKSIADAIRFANYAATDPRPIIVMSYIMSAAGWPFLLALRGYKWAKFGFKKKA